MLGTLSPLKDQQRCVDFIAGKVKGLLAANAKTLVLVATYTIGKEKILLEIARQCEVAIGVDGAKLKILEKLELLPTPEALAATFTTNMSASDVRFVKWHQCGESVRVSLGLRFPHCNICRHRCFVSVSTVRPTQQAGWVRTILI